METRITLDGIELRAEDGGPERLIGYAALFNSLSEDLGGFREVIAPGAFAETLDGDVRALWQHDTAHVLGRTVAGTLELREDAKGLRFAIEPPPAQWAQDALISIRRGDVTGMSFGFEVPEGGDSIESGKDGYLLRTLHRVNLYEVSPVTFPAYPQTSVSVRDRVEALRAESAPVETIAETDHRARARAAARRRQIEMERLR